MTKQYIQKKRNTIKLGCLKHCATVMNEVTAGGAELLQIQ